MKRWRSILLPIISGLYWASCVHPEGARVKEMPGWELDIRAAICGMCVVISTLLLVSMTRDHFRGQEREDS